MRHTASKTALALALAAASAFAQTQTKIYGFADAQFNANFFNSDLAKKFTASDTFEMELKHANIYFDFKPNERLSALVEVALLDRPSYTLSNNTEDGHFTYRGNPISDAQAKTMAIQAALAALPAGTSQEERDAVSSGTAEKLDLAIAMLHANKDTSSSTDKLGMNIARAYVDVNISDPFKLRVGKFITPAGIWNVDHGSPVVLTVRQPIQTTTTSIFPEAQTGMMGYGTLPMGDHDLIYSGYITGGRIDGSSSLLGSQNGAALDQITDLAYGGHVGVKLDVLKSVALGVSYFNGARRRKYQAVEVAKAIEDLETERIAKIEVTDVYTKKEREYAVGGDAKIEVSNLLVQGEVNYGHNENELLDGTVELLGWYGLVAWAQPINDAVTVTPYAMYESVSSSTDGEGGTGSFKSEGLESFATIVGGVNVALFSNLHVKTEYTYLTFKTDSDTWRFANVSEDDLATGIWSTQVSVAF